jgi:hypothetical protein
LNAHKSKKKNIPIGQNSKSNNPSAKKNIQQIASTQKKRPRVKEKLPESQKNCQSPKKKNVQKFEIKTSQTPKNISRVKKKPSNSLKSKRPKRPKV